MVVSSFLFIFDINTEYFFSVLIPHCIDAHIRRIDPHLIYQIPNRSPFQPVRTPFSQQHLQPGLVNDSNCCCLISIVLCIHRLGLINHLQLPSHMRSAIGSPDYSIGVLAKILQALPSQNAFSIRALIDTWNRARLGTQLGQMEDLFIIDAIMKNVRFRDQGGIPTLTQYRASFHCPRCQVQYRGITGMTAFHSIPELPLPDQANPIHPADLMTDLMRERFAVTCQVCHGNVHDASYEIVKGKVTIVRLNRMGFRGGNTYKIMTPIDHGPNQSLGGHYLGELVAVVCHRSAGGLHWVSYSKTDNGWFCNNDHRLPAPSSPLNSGIRGETLNLLCYKN